MTAPEPMVYSYSWKVPGNTEVEMHITMPRYELTIDDLEWVRVCLNEAKEALRVVAHHP